MSISHEMISYIERKYSSYEGKDFSVDQRYLLLIKSLLKLVNINGLADEPFEFKNIRFLEHSKANVDKILISESRMIGDAINLRLLAQQLKNVYPNAEIHCLLTNYHASKILAVYPEFDEVYGFDTANILNLNTPEDLKESISDLKTFLSVLKDKKFDLCYSINRTLASMVALSLIEPREIIGWSLNKDKTVGFQGNIWHYYLFYKKNYIHYAEHLQYLHSDSLEHIPVADLAQNLKYRSDKDGFGGMKCYALIPGSRIKEKMWPKEKFLALMNLIKNRYSSCPVLIGGNKDKDICDWLEMNYDGSILNFAGESSLEELPSLLSKCEFVISNDTGPKHVAAFSNLPVVELTGQDIFWNYGAYSKGAIILSADDLKLITPKAVLRSLEILKGYTITAVDEDLEGLTVYQAVSSSQSSHLIYRVISGRYSRTIALDKIIDCSFKNLLFIINGYVLKRDPSKLWVDFDCLPHTIAEFNDNCFLIVEELKTLRKDLALHQKHLKRLKDSGFKESSCLSKKEIDEGEPEWFKSFASFLWSISFGKSIKLDLRLIKYFELRILSVTFIDLCFQRLESYLLNNE